jgi:hypothetical protein
MLELTLATLGALVLLLAVVLAAVALLAVVFAPFDESDEQLTGLHDDEDWH